MKPIVHPVSFHDDHDNRVMRSGHGLPSEPARATMNTFEPGLNDAEGQRVARWESSDKKAQPLYCPEAVAATHLVVNSPETRELVAKAPAANEAVITANMLGLPNGYSRTEVIIKQTDTYIITRSSDGTVRTDLICKGK